MEEFVFWMLEHINFSDIKISMSSTYRIHYHITFFCVDRKRFYYQDTSQQTIQPHIQRYSITFSSTTATNYNDNPQHTTHIIIVLFVTLITDISLLVLI